MHQLCHAKWTHSCPEKSPTLLNYTSLDRAMILGYNLLWMRVPQVEWFPHKTPGILYRKYAV